MNTQFNRIKNLTQSNEANILIDEVLLNLNEFRRLTNDIRKMEELIIVCSIA